MKFFPAFLLGIFIGSAAGAYGMDKPWNYRIEQALKKAGMQKVGK